MDQRVADVSLINQATPERAYGVQDAPSTHSGIWSVYDEIATDYDQFHSPVDDDEKVGLLRILGDLRPALGDTPTVLDVGCGTGAVLDLGITTPDRYTGVDPSQAMLNELLMKHNRSRFASILPGRIEDVLPSLAGQKFDLVIAAFGSASYVEPRVIDAIARLAQGATLVMAYADGYRPAFHDAEIPSAAEASERLRKLAANVRTTVERVGKFDTVTLRA